MKGDQGSIAMEVDGDQRINNEDLRTDLEIRRDQRLHS